MRHLRGAIASTRKSAEKVRIRLDKAVMIFLMAPRRTQGARAATSGDRWREADGEGWNQCGKPRGLHLERGADGAEWPTRLRRDRTQRGVKGKSARGPEWGMPRATRVQHSTVLTSTVLEAHYALEGL